MARHKDSTFTLPDKVQSWDQAIYAVMLDIRDELKALNKTMQCSNTQMIPHYLRDIKASVSRVDKRLAMKTKLKGKKCL